ncbi:MAG: hypothetical protein ABSG40_14095 [Terriglobales bacterium]|jgi:hypothetical protein
MKSTWIYPLAMAGFFGAGILFCLSIEDQFRVSAIVVPSIIIICIALITVIARNNPFLFRVMIVALVVKLLAAWIYTALPAYELSDIKGIYFDGARQFSESSVPLAEWFSLQSLWGTDFIIAIAASLFSLMGPSLAGAMALFSIASFWGQFLFYCAFVRAFPNGNRRTAALVLFFFPSVVFWTAAFGKDALTLLAISFIVYGIARRFDARGWTLIVTGLVLASLVRPHIGAFLAVSLFMSFLVADISCGGRRMIGLKLLLFPVFLVICLAVVIYSRDSLQFNSVDDAKARAESSYTNNQIGGSAFNEGETVEIRLVQSPALMFRPFPWEVPNLTAVPASCESVVLFLVIFFRRKYLFRLLRNARSNPLVVFSILFFLIFSVVFSISSSNFGLLARQRVMVLPLILTLIVASESFPSRPTRKLAHA